MFFNKKNFLLILILILPSKALSSIKNNIIHNLESIENLSFNFEQNINGKIENGQCTIEYPKKIFCNYNLGNNKILVSNGRSIVIKTSTSYYIYPIEKTPLNIILNKSYLLNKIQNSKERMINDKLINFKFFENDNEINLFFDKNTYNLIGWQTLDIFQNLSITYINSITKNKDLEKNLFKLPAQN
jgi:outer membrane lipoprotein-sorting protein